MKRQNSGWGCSGVLRYSGWNWTPMKKGCVGSSTTSARPVSGFLPEERVYMDKFADAGLIDTFRMFDEGENNFTWWSYRTRARERNAGWRLDYFYVNEEIRDNVKSAEILSEIYGSDHCPVTLELEF
jgi:exodeoxyribonuclease III